MRRLMALTLLFAVVVTPAVFAQARRTAPQNSFASDMQVVPVMGNVPGVGGAVFQSYVAILNPTSRAFPISVALYDTNGTRRDATISLGAGELRIYQNFLDSVFQYQGGGAVSFNSNNPANRFIVNTEVRTSGTHYSTSIPALEFAGSSSRSYAAGVSVNADTRTNVGCFNQSGMRNRIRATVFDGAGAQAGAVTLDLAPNAWGQTAITSIVSNGYVQFDPEDAAVCYAVVVDNTTHDGRFVSAVEFEP